LVQGHGRHQSQDDFQLIEFQVPSLFAISFISTPAIAGSSFADNI